MMHCLNTGNSEKSEMSVLERQHFRLKLQQQLPVTCYLNENEEELGGPFLGDQGLSELVNGSMKPDFRRFLSSEFEMNYALPSCPAAEVMTPGEGETSKKRKADKTHKEEKKMKGCAEEESTTTSATTGSSNTKKNAKDTCAPKTDYIHVRARRGQATDSHSLAERVRREKISERMKYLQDLVPGCNKITGKAGMLDEIINYVQSLQRQVEFLSMKLAAINPRLDFDVENYLLKEIMGASSSDQFNLQFNSTSALGGVVMVGNDPMAMDMQQQLRRTTSAPITIPHAFLDSSNLSQIQPIAWEDELQSFYNMEYQQGRSTPFIPQPFTGFQEQGHVKLEM